MHALSIGWLSRQGSLQACTVLITDLTGEQHIELAHIGQGVGVRAGETAVVFGSP